MSSLRPVLNGPLDPWDDAKALQDHLATPGAELLVLLGAEAWCDKCKRIKPEFDVLCANELADHVAALWLDLEDHAEFIGSFVPDDLPLLLHWRAGHCVQTALVHHIDPAASPPVNMVDMETPSDLPNFWRVFART